MKAVEKLRSELNKLLRSLGADLVKQDWWNDGWEAVENNVSEGYIANERWDLGSDYSDYAVWIGVEGFSPERIFGQESPPILYVWISNRRNDLAQRLAKELEQGDWEILGDTDTRATGYVVRDSVKKCLPEEIETYGETVRPQIIEFLSHYAEIMMQLDPIIQDYLKTE
jgi:hypothetical protein